MGNNWKLGYIDGLSSAGSYEAGKEMYDKFSAEVLTLESQAFVFPENRNPSRIDEKRMIKGVFQRFPYYEGGYAIPLGYEADDIQLTVILTNKTDADNLEAMLKRSLDYMGNDSFYSTANSDNMDGTAPYILEMGYHNVNRQKLIHLDNYKITKDAKNSDNYFEFDITFKGYSTPVYRGM